MALKPGIYEQLVNKETEDKLSGVDDKNKKLEDIDSGTASLFLSQYVKDVVRKALERSESIEAKLKLTNEIIDTISSKNGNDDLGGKEVSSEAKTLLEIKDPVSHLTVNTKNRPATSLTHSYLFTGDIDMPLVQEFFLKD